MEKPFKMSLARREALMAFNNSQQDWYGTCRHCGERIEGSIQKIKDHKCGLQTVSKREPT